MYVLLMYGIISILAIISLFMNDRRMASATFHPHKITKLKELSITQLSTLRETLGEFQNCT